MKLWKRVSGALKDQKSLLKSSFTSRSAFRNPDIETTVIKATTHDESRVDYRSAQRVFSWVGISDECLHLVLCVLFRRTKRTHNWVVALKGLMVLHGVFCCKVSGIQEIGRLPFDLLNLKDKHTKHGKTLGLNSFIRAYYVFLDEKSSFIFLHSQEQRKRREILSHYGTHEEDNENVMIRDFIWLQKLQGLLDKLLKIQPKSSQTVNVLVLEAMDCTVIEIHDIYSRISNGIGTVLVKISTMGENEAIVALSILQKAKVQHEQVSLYFEFCSEIGVGNASECPKMKEIPEDVIRELEDVINGDPKHLIIDKSPKEEVKSIIVVEDHKFMKIHDRNNSMSSVKTVITDDWEVFEEEQKKSNLIDPCSYSTAKNNARFDRFVQANIVKSPDLISF